MGTNWPSPSSTSSGVRPNRSPTGLGQIDYLADIVKPDVGVITNVGDAHIERLGSRENILKAKCELLPHVKSGGMVVLNGDDALLSGLRGNTPIPAVFCGRGEGCEYRAGAGSGAGPRYC